MEDYLSQQDLINKVNKNKRFIRNNEAIIYCLIKNNEIVYVGQSSEFLERLAQHSRYKRGKFDSYAIIENLGVLCSQKTLCEKERYYIELLKPKLNKTFVKSGKKRRRKREKKLNLDTSKIRRIVNSK